MRKYLLAGLVVGLDQLIKNLFVFYSPQLIEYNEGLVFGVEFSQALLFNLVMLIVLLALMFISHSSDRKYLLIAFAGGFSNLLDRLLYGGVVDIRFSFLPATNLADLVIIVALALVLLSVWQKNDKKQI